MKKKLLIITLSILLTALFLTGCGADDGVEPTTTDYGNGSGFSEMTVHFIDVGQGDCTFVDAGEYEILIDAGYYEYGDDVGDYIRPFVDGPLELVIGSHAHEDHIGGLIPILEEFEVYRVIYSGEKSDSYNYNGFVSAAREQGCELTGDTDEVITFDDLRIDIFETFDDNENCNNNSVIALFTYNDFSFLTTGDAEIDAEYLFMNELGKIDVFRAAHHGSSTSNSPELFSIIRPDYTIVSAEADNEYGHPHVETMELILDYGKGLGTFKSGTIVLTTDGTDYSFNTDKYLTWEDAHAEGDYDDDDGNYDGSNGNDSYTDAQNSGYVGNKNSQVFHKATCESVEKMAEHNKVNGFTYNEFIAKGYEPCGACM